MSLSLLYQLPQYLVFWLLSCNHTVLWNPLEIWNFHFQLYFLVHVYTKALPYWILASNKTANAHTFLNYMPPFVLLLDKFVIFTHYMRYSLISCATHPTKGWLSSVVNIVLDKVSPYRLLLGTTYQSLGASFQISFSDPSPCVILILALHISSKLSIHALCNPFIFSLLFFSFLEFFRLNCFLMCYSSTCFDYN